MAVIGVRCAVHSDACFCNLPTNAEEAYKARLDAISRMSKDELRAVPYAEIGPTLDRIGAYGFKADPRQEEQHQRVRALFQEDAAPYVKAFEEAYAADPSAVPAALVEALSKEHGFVVLRVFSALTAQGIADLDKARWAHRALCYPVLSCYNPRDYDWHGPKR